MNKKEKLAFAFVAALAMTSGGFAMGQSVNIVSSDQVIYACVTGVNGNITRVSNTPKTCPKGTTPISWNMVGPKGDSGLQGVQGLPGPKGDKGLDGVSGSTGGSGWYLSNPTTNVKYEISYLPVDLLSAPRPSLKIDGKYWLIGSEGQSYTLRGFENETLDFDSPLKYFATTECTGDAYLTTTPSGLISDLVYSKNGRLYAVNNDSKPNLGSIKSVAVPYWYDRWETWLWTCTSDEALGVYGKAIQDLAALDIPSRIKEDDKILGTGNGWYRDWGIDLSACTWKVDFYTDSEWNQYSTKDYLENQNCPQSNQTAAEFFPGGDLSWINQIHDVTSLTQPNIRFFYDEWVVGSN